MADFREWGGRGEGGGFGGEGCFLKFSKPGTYFTFIHLRKCSSCPTSKLGHFEASGINRPK